MSPKKFSLSFLFFLLFSLTLSSSFSLPKYDSVYDLLRAHGLPAGIIPKGVTKNDFTYNYASQKLQINLSFLEANHNCTVTRTLEYFSYPVYTRVELQPTISAILDGQHLGHIKGITGTVTFEGIPFISNEPIVGLRGSHDGKRLQFQSTIVKTPEFTITDEFRVPQTCEADLTVSPINMMPWLGGIVENENQDDDVDN